RRRAKRAIPAETICPRRSRRPPVTFPTPDGSRAVGRAAPVRSRALRQNHSGTATPAGFESVRDLTRPHVECTNTRQDAGVDGATADQNSPLCNDCNEVTPRLALVAKNALLNGDFPRIIEILDRLSRGRCAELPRRRTSQDTRSDA